MTEPSAGPQHGLLHTLTWKNAQEITWWYILFNRQGQSAGHNLSIYPDSKTSTTCHFPRKTETPSGLCFNMLLPSFAGSWAHNTKRHAGVSTYVENQIMLQKNQGLKKYLLDNPCIFAFHVGIVTLVACKPLSRPYAQPHSAGEKTRT